MKSNELYVAVGLVGGTALVSWFFSCEVLFLMSIVVTLVLASVIGVILGSLMLTERMILARERSKQEWAVPAKSSATQ